MPPKRSVSAVKRDVQNLRKTGNPMRLIPDPCYVRGGPGHLYDICLCHLSAKEFKPFSMLKAEEQKQWAIAHARPLTEAKIEWESKTPIEGTKTRQQKIAHSVSTALCPN